jgi:hypothetical protein
MVESSEDVTFKIEGFEVQVRLGRLQEAWIFARWRDTRSRTRQAFELIFGRMAAIQSPQYL